MLDAFCSQPSYLHHLEPIWRALDPAIRGTFWTSPRIVTDLPNATPGRPERSHGGYLLTAGFSDSRPFGRAKVCLVEHGAGQSYLGVRDSSSGSYSGGLGRENVEVFVVPRLEVAERNRARYPDATYLIAAPRVEFLRGVRGPRAPIPRSRRPIIAFAFHAHIPAVAESLPAFEHYRAVLRDLASDTRFELLGHGHPRLWKRYERFWRTIGVEPVAEAAEVIRRADVLCVDNSSLGFESAACGIPIVWLSAPWYRRDVEHGLRFWDAISWAEHVEEPADLASGIECALQDPWREVREQAVSRLYPVVEGSAARVARALEEWVGGNEQPRLPDSPADQAGHR